LMNANAAGLIALTIRRQSPAKTGSVFCAANYRCAEPDSPPTVDVRNFNYIYPLISNLTL